MWHKLHKYRDASNHLRRVLDIPTQPVSSIHVTKLGKVTRHANGDAEQARSAVGDVKLLA